MSLNLFRASESEVKHRVRAKYYITPDGELKLAQVQYMSKPVFTREGFEKIQRYEKAVVVAEAVEAETHEGESKDVIDLLEEDKHAANQLRAMRRARTVAFDRIMCNHDLDMFVTFTFSGEMVEDRTSWEDVYERFRQWLTNRVQRKGLKYVVCAERHKKDGIHFHAIMNSSALQLQRAINPHTGKPIKLRGKQVYNLVDWKGFTTAVKIGKKPEDREKVSKYIFKYMRKAGLDGKIGGRYLLKGGDLKSPIYFYGDDPTEYLEGETCMYETEGEYEGIVYRSWGFI